jgi:multidrug efflux pump subunit AcrA (membrane-fusion protein)
MLTRYGLPVVAVLTLAFAASRMIQAHQVPPTVDPPIEPGKSPYVKQLAGAGIVEPETENIAVGTHAPGVVDKLFVKVGQTVRPGDPLFQLDERSLRAELKVREAAVLSARASLAKLDQTPRADERPTIEAKVAEAEVNLRDQSQLYERARRAAASVSEEELTRRQMAVELAKAQLARVKADLKFWEAGAWAPDKEIARAAVAQAQAQLNQTETEIGRLTARAPHAKWLTAETGEVTPQDMGSEYRVLQVNIRPGEYVGNNPGQALVVLGYVGKLHVRADLDENDIARFRPDLPGVAKPRGNPDVSFPLRFVRVDPYVIPKKSLTGANTERVDTRVLQVIYAIDATAVPLYVGQQVDVFLNATK